MLSVYLSYSYLFTDFLITIHYYYASVFNIFNVVDVFSDFCYIAKYGNYDGIKILAGIVCLNHPQY